MYTRRAARGRTAASGFFRGTFYGRARVLSLARSLPQGFPSRPQQMLVDAHLHCSGQETTGEVLRFARRGRSRRGGAARSVPHRSLPVSTDRESLRAGNAHLSALVRGHTDRLIGFAVVNPLASGGAGRPRGGDRPGRPARAEARARPAGTPTSERAHAVYARAAGLGLPILFHSGIFIDGRSGSLLPPAFYEAVRDHPTLRVTLAHLGWPWCDEANAVGVIDLINGVDPDDSQFRFDISFGPPPIYRTRCCAGRSTCWGPG